MILAVKVMKVTAQIGGVVIRAAGVVNGQKKGGKKKNCMKVKNET